MKRGRNMSEKNENEKERYCKWMIGPNNSFIPASDKDTTKEIPAGLYKIQNSMQIGYYLTAQEIFVDQLLELPIKEVNDIIKDIKNFWSKEEKFNKYNFVYKRGILLYGPPGCGKSGVIQRLMSHLINEKNGIILSIGDYSDLERYMAFVPNILRKIEPDRPIITIIEDVDGLIDRSSAESLLLNVLDGMKQTNKIVYIATTNYPEKLKERLLNRPSRFDKRYKISAPNAKVRKYFFENKLNKDDLEKIDIKKWVEASEGFTLAHLREMIVSIIVMGNNFKVTVERLKKLKILPSSTEDRESGIGFNFKD